MFTRQEIFNRTERLLGEEAMCLLAQKQCIVFGVGGVGSWCAEGLVRSGVEHITIVDADNVAVSNINRQIMATTTTVGMSKVEVLKARLLQINPQAEIIALQKMYDGSTYSEFALQDYDYVIDAIDTLSSKMELLLHATERSVSADGTPNLYPKVFSSMGAALKIDATQIRVGEFWQVEGCPLARALRRRMKHQHRFPQRKIQCVYSPEVLDNKIGTMKLNEDSVIKKTVINGSLVHITAIMGFTLASLVVQDVAKPYLAHH